jgi:hypothetical protein
MYRLKDSSFGMYSEASAPLERCVEKLADEIKASQYEGHSLVYE